MKIGDLVTDGQLTGIILDVFSDGEATSIVKNTVEYIPVAVEMLTEWGIVSQWATEIEVISESLHN